MFDEIYAQVRLVPVGRVVSYGQVARAIGSPRGARTVGWAMRSCPDDVPWHRVVNAKGEIRTGKGQADGTALQRVLLESEGVEFLGDHVDMGRFRWDGIEEGAADDGFQGRVAHAPLS